MTSAALLPLLPLLLLGRSPAQEPKPNPEPADPVTTAAEPAPTAPAARHIDDFQLRRSPRGAVFRSLVLPGWGQYYTGHPRKAVLALSVEAGLLGWALYETGPVDRALDASRRAGETEDDYTAGRAPHYAKYIERFEFRRDLLVYLGVAAVGFAIDAYVDAWLYGRDREFDDFPEPGDYRRISLGPVLDPTTGTLGLTLTATW